MKRRPKGPAALARLRERASPRTRVCTRIYDIPAINRDVLYILIDYMYVYPSVEVKLSENMMCARAHPKVRSGARVGKPLGRHARARGRVMHPRRLA